MKKYNMSEIMKNAWSMKKSYHARALTFSDCLKMAWAKAKAAVEIAEQIGKKFVNGMTVTAQGYTRTLSRWTKGNMDRIYINGGSRSEKGSYYDLKNRVDRTHDDLTFTKEIVRIIESLEF